MESLKLSYIAVQNINGTTVWWLDKFTQLKPVSHELPIPLLCVFPREKKKKYTPVFLQKFHRRFIHKGH